MPITREMFENSDFYIKKEKELLGCTGCLNHCVSTSNHLNFIQMVVENKGKCPGLRLK